MPPDANPYVGPRPFETGDADFFFGRDREIADLVALIVSSPIVLLYAASGAGKSSLLNAAVIGRLERDQQFEVLPVARVRGLREQDLNADRNVFVSAVMSHLTGGESMTGSLSSFLQDCERGETADEFPAPRALVIDQLEELFTAYPERWDERPAFFEDLGKALREDPLLRVVLSIREDFLAQLDPYARLLPDGLRARYRLERLSAAAALRAAKEPALRAGHPFADGVAEQLVQDLQKMRLDTELGPREIVGEYVEPVQLQVACRSVWEALPDSAGEITEEHREQFGNVDEVLGAFYDEAIRAAATAAHMSENALRSRFAERFITPMGTRGTVFWTREETGGISTAAIEELDSRHLVRAELRAGARWYELTHDRLIEPIRASNGAFDARRRARRRRQALVASAAFVVAAAVAVAAVALTSSNGGAPPPRADAVRKRTAAETRRLERSLADARLQLATALARTSSGALATRFDADVGDIRSLTYARNGNLVAVGSRGTRTWRTDGAHASSVGEGSGRPAAYVMRDGRSLTALADGRLLLGELGNSKKKLIGRVRGGVTGIALGPDAQFAAAVDRGGALRTFNTGTAMALLKSPIYRSRVKYASPTFGNVHALVAVVGSDGYVRLANADTKSIGKLFVLPADLAGGIALSEDGKLLAAWGSGETLALLDTDGNVIGAFPDEHVAAAAFSPSGDRLATAARDGKVQVWKTLPDLKFAGTVFTGKGSRTALVAEVGNVGGSASLPTAFEVVGAQVLGGGIQTHAKTSDAVSAEPAKLVQRGERTVVPVPALGAGKHATFRLRIRSLGRPIELHIVRNSAFTEQSYTNNGISVVAPGDTRAKIVRAALAAVDRSDEIRFDNSTFHATMQGVLDHVHLPHIPKTSTTPGFVTWCYQEAGAPDPNAQNYLHASGTFLREEGRETTSPRPGDLVFYRGSVAPGEPVGPATAVFVGEGDVVTFVNGRIKRVPVRTLSGHRTIRTYPLR
jgi:hypothetical protein